MKKLIIAITSLVLFISCFENMDNLKTKNRIFRTGDKFFVVYEGKIFELSKDLYLTQDKKVEQYFTTGFLQKINIDVVNKAELLNDLNKYFPKRIEYVTEGENISSTMTLPVVTVANKKYIDSIKFDEVVK